MLQTLARLALPLLLAVPAAAQAGFATEVFVDAVNGDDAKVGTVPGAPFRTFTRATSYIQTVTASSFDVHQLVVAPGLYNAALGETFPIRLRTNVVLRTTTPAGGTPPIIDADGAPIAIIAEGEDPIHPNKGMRGLDIEDAGKGLVLELTSGVNFVRYASDLHIRDCDTGIEVTQPGSGDLDLQLSGSSVEDCRVGLSASGDVWAAGNRVDFLRCQDAGVLAVDARRISLSRGSVTDCDRGVVIEHTGARETSTVISGVIAGCREGVSLTETPGLDATITISRATIARCRNGVLVGSPSLSDATVTESILAENVLDVAPAPNGLMARESLEQSGALTGLGVITGDPLFRDGAAGDFRLSPGSPSIDVLPIQFPILPEYDGNLDTFAASDQGAIEFAPLDQIAPALVGGTAVFEVMGDPGPPGVALLETAPVNQFTASPYGVLNLHPGSLIRVERLFVDPVTGFATWTLPIPSDPTLVGRYWTVQAWMPSAASPSGAAFTNSLLVEIQ